MEEIFPERSFHRWRDDLSHCESQIVSKWRIIITSDCRDNLLSLDPITIKIMDTLSSFGMLNVGGFVNKIKLKLYPSSNLPGLENQSYEYRGLKIQLSPVSQNCGPISKWIEPEMSPRRKTEEWEGAKIWDRGGVENGRWSHHNRDGKSHSADWMAGSEVGSKGMEFLKQRLKESNSCIFFLEPW